MEWIIKNPIFYWYLVPFLSEAVEASLCYFFENWFMKLKCPHLLKPLGTIFQQNYWFFYPSEPFIFVHFNMIHPVCAVKRALDLCKAEFYKNVCSQNCLKNALSAPLNLNCKIKIHTYLYYPACLFNTAIQWHSIKCTAYFLYVYIFFSCMCYFDKEYFN